MGDEFQSASLSQPPVIENPLPAHPWVPVRWPLRPRRRWYHSLPFHLGLLLLTILTTLIVGTHIEINYAQNLPVFDWEVSRAYFQGLWHHPGRLVLGVPFSFTLLSILLAHELGHYLTCRHYGIHATYPYFIPAPTLIGTLGAFIRIKSPIVTRRRALSSPSPPSPWRYTFRRPGPPRARRIPSPWGILWRSSCWPSCSEPE